MVIAITGATGFLGKALLSKLSLQHKVVALVRKKNAEQLIGVEYRVCGDLSPEQDWKEPLSGVDAIIHTAARVHIMHEQSSSEQEYRRINVEGTLNLARQAANMGVKRFVFVSSIKVNGELTNLNQAFKAQDTPKPEDAYGLSKMEAELGLFEISKATDMEVVCIRPPLVYGPGVKGNFLSLLSYLERGLLLPLGAINNQRSLVALDNLVDLIATCLDHPAAPNNSFLVSDDEDMSTTVLLQRIGKALNIPARLVPVPPKLLGWMAKSFGKEAVVQRLLGNLQVNISQTKECLGWEPPVSVDDQLKKTAEWYLTRR